MLYKYRYTFYAAFGLLFLVLFTLMFAVFSDTGSTYDFEQKATRLNGVFATYEGKVYAMVPSNGYYEVKGANAASFKVFPDNFQDAHIGYDDRHVYAGNLILKGLNPATLEPLGNNYYTDGTAAYYCSRNSERNTSLWALTEIAQLVGERIGIAAKPQSYWYPAVALPPSKTGYQAKEGYGIAVNSQQVFYKGLPLPAADPQNIKPVAVRRQGRADDESTVHYSDGKQVYYQDQLLPLAAHPDVYELHIEGDIPSRNTYLADAKNGMVYADGHAFDAKKAPYRLLSAALKHANQVLFAAKDGIYFYNAETEKVERAGKNPFVQNNFEEIAPDVFRSGDKIFYLSAGEVWGHKSGLQSRNTHLMSLNAVTASGMRHIGDANNRYGNIWQSGSRYFYFDDLGSSQLMPQAIYEVKDAATAQELATTENLSTDNIRNLLSAGRLVPAASEKLLSATTDYDNPDRKAVFWIIGGGIALTLLMVFLLRNKKIAPFILKDEWLIINNLSFKKYRIAEIEKVVFKIERAPKSGYKGKMQVWQTNGKASWFVTFMTKVTLMPESEVTVRAYVEELQAELQIHGIKSELVR